MESLLLVLVIAIGNAIGGFRPSVVAVAAQ